MRTTVSFAVLTFLLACSTSAKDKAPVHYALSSPQRSILTDCSGVAYRPESKTYFVIENRTGNIFEINKSKCILNMYPSGIRRDPEGITYAGNNTFYVSGEAENGIYEIELKEGRFHRKRTARVNVPAKPGNCGLEGIAYCRPRNTLFCVKEKTPVLVLEISLDEASFGEIKRQVEFKGVRDLAGAAYDETSDRLLLLSEMDKCVVVVDPDTFKEVGRFRVHGGQPEGICLDEDGLCIISEPSHCLFYRPQKSEERSASAPATK